MLFASIACEISSPSKHLDRRLVLFNYDTVGQIEYARLFKDKVDILNVNLPFLVPSYVLLALIYLFLNYFLGLWIREVLF